MKRIISLCSICVLLLLLCPMVHATETNTEDTVNHVAMQYTPNDLVTAAGNVLSGNLNDFSLLDQKTMSFRAAAGNDGKYHVRIQVQFPNVAVDSIQSAKMRLAIPGTPTTVSRTIRLYDGSQEAYVAAANEANVLPGGLEDVEILGQNCLIANENNTVWAEVEFSASEAFDIAVDQIQLLTLCEESVNDLQVQHYTVTTGRMEQGQIAESSSFANLADKDGVSLAVSSSANKVAWASTIPLYHEKNQVVSIQIDYSGRVSRETNVLWLSLYRFDTNNWEVVGIIPGSTASVSRSFVISDDGIENYISEDGDVRVRVYNSATQSFTRYTDYLAVTIAMITDSQQSAYSPTSVYAEYGTSSGLAADLAHVDGQGLYLESDSNRKIATQIQFTTDVDIDSIGEVTFAIRLKSREGINLQYISLKNYNTGSFTVVKTLSGNDQYDMVRFTLDSLKDIEQYIDDNGQVVLRIYNSASSAAGSFTREIDFVQMTVTYGRFSRFSIAQVSDVHELIGTNNFKAIISEINTKLAPQFTIVSGDITDHGTPAQYALYLQDKQLFANTVYTLPGNHDVRWWNANGKKTFTDQVGPLFQSFNYGGVHFVLLDTTVNFELDAKVNKAQLEWLKADVESIPEGMPVILFGHHPFKINNNVTGRHELLRAVQGANVVAFMNGHVHYYGNVVEDGIPINYITFVKDNQDQEFVSIEFTSNYYYIYKHKAADHSKTLWLTGRMINTRQMDLEITEVVPSSNQVAVTVDISNAPDGVESVQARIDNYGPYTQLTCNADGNWYGVINTTAYTPELVAGAHFVGVEAFDCNGLKWTAYQEYSTQGNTAEIKWVFETGDLIQSSATICGSNVFVGSNDGKVYCIDRNTGTEKWRYGTAGRIVSKPAITEAGNVVIGSEDQNLYCLSQNDGSLVWSVQLSGSVLSDPLIADGFVYTGCGDGKIYCINASSGQVSWSYQTGGLMRQRPVIENGTLYAFVRDTYIWYAINAASGELIWRGNANTDESLFVCGDVRPVIAGGKLWCIDAQNTRPGYLNLNTGALAWTGTLDKVSSRGMATDGVCVYYSSNSGRQITAYNVQTNAIVWQKDLRYNGRDSDLQEMQIDTGLVCQNGILFHVAERGRITAINTANGTILWSIDAAGFPERVFWSTPEVSDNIIISTGIDGKVYAVGFGLDSAG